MGGDSDGRVGQGTACGTLWVDVVCWCLRKVNANTMGGFGNQSRCVFGNEEGKGND